MSRYFDYSEKYDDGVYEYRIVKIPKQQYKITKTLSENEWRDVGVQQSPGWVNYAVSIVDNALIFKRELSK